MTKLSNWNKLIAKEKINTLWGVWTVLSMLCIGSFLPLFSIGNIAEYSSLIKYNNLETHVCLGGNNLRNYQILPTIYNTSLTYFPARLQVTTQYWQNSSDSAGLIPVELIYPTKYMSILDCECNNKGCDRKACDKMVGDVITKYHELQALDEFPCYIYNGRVVGLDNDQAYIDSSYVMVTAGIVILVVWVICTGILFCKCVNIHDAEFTARNNANMDARNNANVELEEKKLSNTSPKINYIVQNKSVISHKPQTIKRDGVTYQSLDNALQDNSSDL